MTYRFLMDNTSLPKDVINIVCSYNAIYPLRNNESCKNLKYVNTFTNKKDIYRIVIESIKEMNFREILCRDELKKCGECKHLRDKFHDLYFCEYHDVKIFNGNFLSNN